tara:strand:+ start:907 stop:1566 length:660 start_codon:yes stop_codon:yes gene_type:complete
MSNYFSKVPNLEYVSRLPDANISDYIAVKNLFKKGKLRDDIFENLAYFEKYQIVNNDRPDNVAFEIYNDSTLDWVVLAANNILNIQTEWPMTQFDFDNFLLDKYGSYEKLNDVHHYETYEVRNPNNDIIMVQAGLRVSSNYTTEYFDGAGIVKVSPVTPVTNYEYEAKIQDDKRNIFILRPRYLGVVKDDLEIIMTYKEGSSQYMTESLKRADNIRLYE